MVHGSPPRTSAARLEPVHAPLDAEPPACVAANAGALAEWRRLVPMLTRGHVLTTDRAVFAGFCLMVSRWQRLEAECVTAPLFVAGARKHDIPNPIFGMANKAFVLMVKAADACGFTPIARTHVSVTPTPPTPADPFEAFQRRRAPVRGRGRRHADDDRAS
jgi:P27 family predicted phage terminase small subunit